MTVCIPSGCNNYPNMSSDTLIVLQKLQIENGIVVSVPGNVTLVVGE